MEYSCLKVRAYGYRKKKVILRRDYYFFFFEKKNVDIKIIFIGPNKVVAGVLWAKVSQSLFQNYDHLAPEFVVHT